MGTRCGKKGLAKREIVDSYAGGWNRLEQKQGNTNNTYGIRRYEETALTCTFKEDEDEQRGRRRGVSVKIYRESGDPAKWVRAHRGGKYSVERHESTGCDGMVVL
jgi:hypothetical protein